MAGVTGRDRGQLLLVGAFVIAVTLIGLTLVLSASNYSRTLSDQDNVVVRGGDALSTRQAVQTDLERHFLHLETTHDRHLEQGTIANEFATAVRAMGPQMQAYYADRSRYVTVTQEPLADPWIEGTNLSFQWHRSGGSGAPMERPGSGSGPEEHWELAQDVQVRNFQLVVTGYHADSDPDNAFNLTFEDTGGGNWSFLTYKDGGSTAVYEVRSPSGTVQTCRRDRSQPDTGMVLDFQTGAITEVTETGVYRQLEPCPALTAIDLDGQHYDVNITDGNLAQGRFRAFVDDPPGSPNVNDDFFDPDGYGAEAILYGANVNVQYYSTTVTYNATIEVAPKEFS